MLIKIIQNSPADESCSDITKYIGEVYETIGFQNSKGEVEISLNGARITLFPLEYIAIEDFCNEEQL